MKIKNINFFYFLGIGGIGMSSLARYFNSQGKLVCGYDKTCTNLTKNLEKEGISISYKDDVDILPNWIYSNKCLIIYTSAISSQNRQWNFIKKNVKNIKKRSEVLSLITKNSICIAIAGTHGKTTTCCLLGHILYSANIKFTAFIGGISKNYKSNLILNGNKFILVEADEFDHSFLYLYPNIACITSLDQDHIDTYPNIKYLLYAYLKFSKNLVYPYKKIFLYKKSSFSIKNATYFSILEKEYYYSDNVFIHNNKWYFDFHTPKDIFRSLPLPIPGFHNLINVTAALSIAHYLKISHNIIRKSLSLFLGVERRYSIHYNNNKIIYIDDYAHHPREIKHLIDTVKKNYPNKKILGIFQPHLFSRTIFFEDKFAESLKQLDSLILLEIYPARECPINNAHISSQDLIKKIKCKEKEISSLSEAINKIKNKTFDILLTIGAGDIDTLIDPIKQWLNKKNKILIKKINKH